MKELVAVDKPIRGTARELETVLRSTSARGRLLTDPRNIRPILLDSGRYEVRVRVYDEVVVSRREQVRRWTVAHPNLTAIGKALAFGVGCSLLVLLGLIALVLGIKHALSGVNLAAVGGGIAVVIALLLVGAGLSSGDGHGHSGWGFHWSKCK